MLHKRPLYFTLLIIVLSIVFIFAYQYYLASKRKDLYSAISKLKDGRFSEARETLFQYAQNGDETAQRMLITVYSNGKLDSLDRLEAEYWALRLICKCEEPGKVFYGTYRSMLADNDKSLECESMYWLAKSASLKYEKARQELRGFSSKANVEGCIPKI